MSDSDVKDVNISLKEEMIENISRDLDNQTLKNVDECEKLDETEELEATTNPLDDLIDEEKLKEIELTLTDEDKLSKKENAEKLKEEGNENFKKGLYMESIQSYTNALRLCPLVYEESRSIFYSNRSASKIKLEYKESALDDLKKAIELNPNYVKALHRRAKLYDSLNKLDESLEDYKSLQKIDPSNGEINMMIHDLSIRIDKRNEEMKTEMLGMYKTE